MQHLTELAVAEVPVRPNAKQEKPVVRRWLATETVMLPFLWTNFCCPAFAANAASIRHQLDSHSGYVECILRGLLECQCTHTMLWQIDAVILRPIQNRAWLFLEQLRYCMRDARLFAGTHGKTELSLPRRPRARHRDSWPER